MLTRLEQLGHLAAYGRWVQQHLLEAYFRVAPLHDLINEGCDILPERHRQKSPVLKSERCSVAQAATILGTPERTVQDMAARGELPGAAKFRRRWTFDLEKLRRHVRQKERLSWQTGEKLHLDATGAAMPSGAGLRSMAGKSDGRFIQVIQRLRGQGARRKAGRERLTADAFHGDSPRTFIEVLEAWAAWIGRKVGPKTAQRYACSLGQLKDFVENKRLTDIDGRLVADIIRGRTADGVSNATIKRDLVALSSVVNFAIDQGWIESNPVLPRMQRIKERRDPITLPRTEDIDLVIGRSPGMVKDLIRAAMATGAREDELLRAQRDAIDHQHRQMTVIGKRNKRRTFELDPFDGYDLIRSLPSYVGSPLLFWHSTGENYKNFASQFSGVVRRTEKWAAANGIDFRPFRFHDLRHWHAVHWLKSGRSIYELQHRLGHTSVKTTEVYLGEGYLTFEEKQAVMVGAGVAQKAAQQPRSGTAGV
jgi:integrase/recombinase XerD